MPPSLPQPTTEAEVEAIDRTSEAFITAIRDQFPARVADLRIQALPVGSCPVFQCGGEVIAKLFCPLDEELYRNEVAALRLLQDAAEVPSPSLIETSHIDGWNIVLMSRVAGTSLRERWSSLSTEAREQLCFALGQVTRSLHRVDPTPLRPSSPRWPDFVETQKRQCEKTQRARGLNGGLAEQIPEYLASVQLHDGEVFLHTELMLEHVFSRDGTTISAVIDFEPSMAGPAEYEFASVGLFIARGNPALLGAFLDGYGHPKDDALSRRIMAMALLHRYSKLSWYLEFMPPGDSLEELATRWFSFS